MAKVNRVFIPAVVVSPAQEVFHLELSAREAALLLILVGNCTGDNSEGHSLFNELKISLGLKGAGAVCTFSGEYREIRVDTADIGRLLQKRQK